MEAKTPRCAYLRTLSVVTSTVRRMTRPVISHSSPVPRASRWQWARHRRHDAPARWLHRDVAFLTIAVTLLDIMISSATGHAPQLLSVWLASPGWSTHQRLLAAGSLAVPAVLAGAVAAAAWHLLWRISAALVDQWRHALTTVAEEVAAVRSGESQAGTGEPPRWLSCALLALAGAAMVLIAIVCVPVVLATVAPPERRERPRHALSCSWLGVHRCADVPAATPEPGCGGVGLDCRKLGCSYAPELGAGISTGIRLSRLRSCSATETPTSSSRPQDPALHRCDARPRHRTVGMDRCGSTAAVGHGARDNLGGLHRVCHIARPRGICGHLVNGDHHWLRRAIARRT